MLFKRRNWFYVACVLAVSACGGGGGDGGSRYSISVSPSSVSLSARTGASAVAQRVTVTFSGEGMVVGTLPGETMPNWLRVSAPTQTSSPAVVDISGYADAPGNYSTTLRFATGRADGSDVSYTDVRVTLQMVSVQEVYASMDGLAVGNSIPVSFNNGAPQNIARGGRGYFGEVAVGSTYTLAVTTQPTGQWCTFGSNGSPTLTAVATPMQLSVQHGITCNANLIPWTWVGGARNSRAEPIYGTRGTPSTGNTPGARIPAAAAGDAAGNLWLFGGGYRNDLWRYDIATNAWTWVSGSTAPNQMGNYGTRNVPASSNVPGGRNDAVGWVDADGNFWLFGGLGVATTPNLAGQLNDLWKYDVAAGLWTWMSGSNQINTQGPDINVPAPRSLAGIAKDGSGAVWIFGGTSSGPLSDLWKFNPASGLWLRAPGSFGVVAERGERGVPAAANHPDGRTQPALWADAAGNIWLFGGTRSVGGMHNDVWRYDPTTTWWTWMHGSDQAGSNSNQSSPGVYGAPGASPDYMPSSRYGMAYWTDASGNFWVFGGLGHSPQPNSRIAMNDLWRYTPATNTWAYLSGSNAAWPPAVYGTQGVPSTSNVPSGRRSVRAAWTDASGQLWLYGGNKDPNFDELMSDIWRATPQ